MATYTAKGEEKRNEILAIADEMFRANGYDHTTLRMIAGKAGISTGHLVHYFSEKKQIMYALSDLMIQNIWDHTEGICLEWAEDPFILYSFAVHWHFLICSHLEDIRIVMEEFERDFENQREFSRRFADRFIQLLEKRGLKHDKKLIKTSVAMAFAAHVCYLSMDERPYNDQVAAETSDNHILMFYMLLGKTRKAAEKANLLAKQKIEDFSVDRIVKPFSLTYRDYVLDGKSFIV